MSTHLTDEDREALDASIRNWEDFGGPVLDRVVPAVESIIARHRAEALEEVRSRLVLEVHEEAHRRVCEGQYRSDRTSAHLALEAAEDWLRDLARDA